MDPSEVDADAVWRFVVAGLAEVLIATPGDVVDQVNANGGDLAIKSKDAEVVISYVEEELGDIELVDQSHLKRTELTSLRALADLLWRRWYELKGGE